MTPSRPRRLPYQPISMAADGGAADGPSNVSVSSRSDTAAGSGADGGPGNAAEGDGLGVRRDSDSSAEGGGGHGAWQARAQAYDRSSSPVDMRDVIAAIRLSPEQGAALVQVRSATMLSTSSYHRVPACVFFATSLQQP